MSKLSHRQMLLKIKLQRIKNECHLQFKKIVNIKCVYDILWNIDFLWKRSLPASTLIWTFQTHWSKVTKTMKPNVPWASCFITRCSWTSSNNVATGNVCFNSREYKLYSILWSIDFDKNISLKKIQKKIQCEKILLSETQNLIISDALIKSNKKMWSQAVSICLRSSKPSNSESTRKIFLKKKEHDMCRKCSDFVICLEKSLSKPAVSKECGHGSLIFSSKRIFTNVSLPNNVMLPFRSCYMLNWKRD